MTDKSKEHRLIEDFYQIILNIDLFLYKSVLKEFVQNITLWNNEPIQKMKSPDKM